MANLLSQLTKAEQVRLLEELNYMNLEEIRGFCCARRIPYRVAAMLARLMAQALGSRIMPSWVTLATSRPSRE